MKNMIPVTRMAAADAVALNERIQAAVSDCRSSYGDESVGPAVIESAAELGAATLPLRPIEAASFALRREVDLAVDRCFDVAINRVNDIIAAYSTSVVPLTEAESRDLASAQWLFDHLFADGRDFLTGRWSEQFGVAEMILREAALPEAQPHIELLGLVNAFDLIRRNHTVYGERMGFTTVLTPSSESAIAKLHEAVAAYLVAVIHTQRRNPELKAKLLAPYETTAKAVRDAKKRAQQSKAQSTENTATTSDTQAKSKPTTTNAG